MTPQTNAPPWMRQAYRELGVNERDNTREIMGYARDGRIPEYADTSVPWCAVFKCAMLERTGIRSPRSAWARNFLKWGQELDAPVYGAIAVLTRGRSANTGHVGFFVREVGDFIELLSGNTSDSVCIKKFPKSSVIAYRWPSEVNAAKPVSTQVPHGTLQTPREAELPDALPTPSAPVPKPAPEVADHSSHKDVVKELRTNGSRTILGVDRIVAHVRKALAALGVTAFTDLIGFEQLKPVMWLCLAALALAILYEATRVEEARVDDHVNGQQDREQK